MFAKNIGGAVSMQTLREFIAKEGAIRQAIRQDFTVSISILEKPKQALLYGDQKFVESLLCDFRNITYDSFGTGLDEESGDGVREHVIGADTLAILHEKDEVLGFAAAKNIAYEGTPIFFLHGIVVARKFSNNGGARMMVKALSSLRRASKMAFTTQNPIMFCLMDSLCKKTYPSPLHRKVRNDHWRLGKELLAGRTGNFNPKTFIIEKLYGKCLYNRIPDSANPYINKWFVDSLQIQDGVTSNGFLLIGEMALA